MDRDERFHELILLAAGNRRLAAIVGRPARHGARPRRLDRRALAQPGGDPGRARARSSTRCEAGDADRAGAAMRYHLRRTGDLLAAQYGGATPA